MLVYRATAAFQPVHDRRSCAQRVSLHRADKIGSRRQLTERSPHGLLGTSYIQRGLVSCASRDLNADVSSNGGASHESQASAAPSTRLKVSAKAKHAQTAAVLSAAQAHVAELTSALDPLISDGGANDVISRSRVKRLVAAVQDVQSGLDELSLCLTVHHLKQKVIKLSRTVARLEQSRADVQQETSQPTQDHQALEETVKALKQELADAQTSALATDARNASPQHRQQDVSAGQTREAVLKQQLSNSGGTDLLAVRTADTEEARKARDAAYRAGRAEGTAELEHGRKKAEAAAAYEEENASIVREASAESAQCTEGDATAVPACTEEERALRAASDEVAAARSALPFREDAAIDNSSCDPAEYADAWFHNGGPSTAAPCPAQESPLTSDELTAAVAHGHPPPAWPATAAPPRSQESLHSRDASSAQPHLQLPSHPNNPGTTPHNVSHPPLTVPTRTGFNSPLRLANHVLELGLWRVMRMEEQRHGDWVYNETVLQLLTVLCQDTARKHLFQGEAYNLRVCYVDAVSNKVQALSDYHTVDLRGRNLLLLVMQADEGNGDHCSLIIANARHKVIHTFDSLWTWPELAGQFCLQMQFPNVDWTRYRVEDHTGETQQTSAECWAWCVWAAFAYAFNFADCRSEEDDAVDDQRLQHDAVAFWNEVTC